MVDVGSTGKDQGEITVEEGHHMNRDEQNKGNAPEILHHEKHEYDT